MTTLRQRLLQPDFQPPGASQLHPKHKHLLMKRSLRCRVCIDPSYCYYYYFLCSLWHRLHSKSIFSSPRNASTIWASQNSTRLQLSSKFSWWLCEYSFNFHQTCIFAMFVCCWRILMQFMLRYAAIVVSMEGNVRTQWPLFYNHLITILFWINDVENGFRNVSVMECDWRNLLVWWVKLCLKKPSFSDTPLGRRHVCVH